MRCFFSLSSISVAAPTLTTATPPASLARRSWSSHGPKSESVSSISRLIWEIGLDVVLGTCTVDDRRVVLGDDHAPCATQQVERRVLELEADLLGDQLGTREDGDVTEHGLAPLAEAGRLHGDRLEQAADLVHDKGREASPSTSSR